MTMASGRRGFLKGAGLVGGALVSVSVIGEPSSALISPATGEEARRYDVTAFGARGDGNTIDSPAINRAIDVVAGAGGGTVYFAAGTYLCYSILLKSRVTLYLEQGATIVAADPAPAGSAGYD